MNGMKEKARGKGEIKVKEITRKTFEKKTKPTKPTSLQEPLTENSTVSKLTPEQQEKLNKQFIEAVQYEGADDVRRMAKLGAGVNSVDKGGITALLWATWYDKIETCRVLAKELGADVNIQNMANWTALHSAAAYGRTETCRVLCWELLANPLLKNKKGQTARNLASNREIKWLLNRYEKFWEAGREGAIKEIVNAVKGCNPEAVREIFAGL